MHLVHHPSLQVFVSDRGLYFDAFDLSILNKYYCNHNSYLCRALKIFKVPEIISENRERTEIKIFFNQRKKSIRSLVRERERGRDRQRERQERDIETEKQKERQKERQRQS